MTRSRPKGNQTSFHAAMDTGRGPVLAVFWLSLVVNLTMLASPLYMLQIYDRVISSGSVETLIVLTALTVLVLVLLFGADLARHRILVNYGAYFDWAVSGPAFDASFQRPQPGARGNEGPAALSHVGAIRQFLSSSGVFAFFDAPFVPVFIGLLFLVHSALGYVALMGGILIFCLALISEFSARRPHSRANASTNAAHRFHQSSLQNVAAVDAMGMLPGLRARWQSHHGQGVHHGTTASQFLSGIGSLTKVIRQGVQVAILGVGAYLTLGGHISAGMMIAASIIMGRALAPIEQSIGAWRSFLSARQALTSLRALFPPRAETVPPPLLPRPVARLRVDQLTGRPAGGAGAPILQQLSFGLIPGEFACIIGHSGVGKSTLAEFLVGNLTPLEGSVRLDSIAMHTWDSQDKGRHIGYMPQHFELFDGTIAENIARFRDEDRAHVYQAARLTHCYDLILNLPGGFDHEIRANGAGLSGGQRQRIALARAFYGNPAFVVLDEPSANLDTQGEVALRETIAAAKAMGMAIIAIEHKDHLVSICDHILHLGGPGKARFSPNEQDELDDDLELPKARLKPVPTKPREVRVKAKP